MLLRACIFQSQLELALVSGVGAALGGRCPLCWACPPSPQSCHRCGERVQGGAPLGERQITIGEGPQRPEPVRNYFAWALPGPGGSLWRSAPAVGGGAAAPPGPLAGGPGARPTRPNTAHPPGVSQARDP